VTHLDEGTLRRLLDQPGDTTSAERHHLTGCAACSARQQSLEAVAREAAGALNQDTAHRLDVASARAVVGARRLAGQTALRDAGSRRRRSTRGPVPPLFAGAAAAAAVALALAFTPLRGVAAGFLAIFEPQHLVAIPVSHADLEELHALPDLSSYGTVQYHERPVRRAAGSATEAAAVAGVQIWVPAAIPSNFGAPHYRVMGQASAAFTFSAAKARTAAQSHGRTPPPMPPGIDGSTLLATLGPVVVAVYPELGAKPRPTRHHGFQAPSLVVAESAAPRVGSTGASAAEIERFLLAQPGVPPRLASEIAAIGDPSSTLPIPIPVDRAYASPVSVQGVRGLGVGDNTGLGAGVLWEQHGTIFAVAGMLPMRDVLTIANSLEGCPAAGARCTAGSRPLSFGASERRVPGYAPHP
jgi:hypothetical protein